ncbi:hypothetical protein LTR22_027807 [Elasticomyces elasticus]|nr:hypothetical protein LTR22_027807 [Elasticomyces elasticus]
MEPKFLDNTAAFEKFMSDLGSCDGQPSRLYADLEGNDLSRDGTLSLVTILLELERDVYLVDVTTLGRDAFTTAGADGRTLKAVLESRDIVKVFFDIRNDPDALFGLYEIRVDGIEDLQLMELASRNFSKRNVNGSAKCIERDSTIPFVERRRWQVVKDNGKNLFDPQRGGSYAVLWTFSFGSSTWVKLADIPRIMNRIFRDPTKVEHRARFDIDVIDAERKIVLVGHGLGSDIRYLQNLGIKTSMVPSIINQADTQKLASSGTLVGLAKLLVAVGIESVNLHNAGNDAVYTLRPFLR